MLLGVMLLLLVGANAVAQDAPGVGQLETENTGIQTPEQLANGLGTQAARCLDIVLVFVYTGVFVFALRITTGDDFAMGFVPLLFGLVASILSKVLIGVCTHAGGAVGLVVGVVLACLILSLSIWKIVKTDFVAAVKVSAICTGFLVLFQLIITQLVVALVVFALVASIASSGT